MLPPFTQQLIAAYTRGSFPMGLDGKGRAIEWVTPNIRGLIPIGGIHCSRSLRKEIKKSNNHGQSFDNEIFSFCFRGM